MRRVLLLAVALLAAALSPSAAAAAPTTLWEECPTGSAAGQCHVPRGIAADPVTGHLFVVDQNNHRVVEMTSWGAVKAWGWGVRDGSAELQTCTTSSGCQKGLVGSGAGQLNLPQGIAIDSQRDVYVVDWINSRVQKFDPTGGPSGEEAELLLSFGSPGTGDGQFGNWEVGSFIAVGPGDEVYVGDVGRVQVFDAGGNYLKSIPLPGEAVQSLAVDPEGSIYLAYLAALGASKADVVKLDPSKPDPVGEPLCTANIANPRALAVDATGNLYAADSSGGSVEIHKFDADCKEIEDGTYPFTDGFDLATGIAVNTVTEAGGIGLYVSNSFFVDSYIRAYFPPPDKWDPPTAPPAIGDQYAVSVSTDGAILRAEINPRFWEDTRYRVEYGTEDCSAGGCQSHPPAPGNLLGGGIVGEDVTTSAVVLSDLEPGVTYHYRFVAQSGGGGPAFGPDQTFTTFPVASLPANPCPNAVFRTGAGGKLPDCRAYEMVSPLDKGSGDIRVAEGLYFIASGSFAPSRIDQATPQGTSITYSAARAFGAAESAPWSSQYLAERAPGAGWANRTINAPRSNFPLNAELGQEVPYKGFSPDLCSGWVLQDTDRILVPGAPENAMNFYRRDNCAEGGGYELLTSTPPPGFSREDAPNSNYFPEIQSSTHDGSHSFLRANAALTPDASPGPTYQLYETSEGPEGRAELRLLSLLPDGTAATVHSSLGTAANGIADFRNDSVHNAVSSDGSRVFWSATTAANPESPPPGGGYGFQPGRVYLRANPLAESSATGECTEAGKACTLQLAGPSSIFWAANPEGSVAILQTNDELFEVEIEEAGEELLAPPTTIAGGVIGVVGQSEDATRVYFTSKEALDPGAEVGKPNLYLHEKGVGVSYLATLGPRDSSRSDAISVDNVKRGWHRARVSPDGRHALFMSTASLTGYDNTDVATGRPDAEAFLYDAEAAGGEGEVWCLSCNPSGARPSGGRLLDTAENGNRQVWSAATVPGWEHQGHASRVLSEDGAFAFFESFEALVPADTNGVADVYEWKRASGEAECEEAGAALYVPSAHGCLSLISSGESPEDSQFIDASSDGRDVFFITNESLFSEDPGLVDVYDARIGGGFAPRPRAPSCQGESCQSPAVAPDDRTPASASFRGPGNQAQPPSARRCPQGKRKVRRAGKTRCVKPARQKRKRERNTKGKAGR